MRFKDLIIRHLFCFYILLSIGRIEGASHSVNTFYSIPFRTDNELVSPASVNYNSILKLPHISLFKYAGLCITAPDNFLTQKYALLFFNKSLLFPDNLNQSISGTVLISVRFTQLSNICHLSSGDELPPLS